MRKVRSLLAVMMLVSMSSVSAMADVTDYVGTGTDKGRCPQVIVVKPEISEKNVFNPVDSSKFETASNMIGQAVSNKYPGSAVISAKDLNQYKSCNVPVALAKLKSYTPESAIFGQHQGNMTVTILHFPSTAADAPDRTIDVSASGERYWGEDQPFMNAVQAVVEKIQKTNF